jgi:hypothetical protein
VGVILKDRETNKKNPPNDKIGRTRGCKLKGVVNIDISNKDFQEKFIAEEIERINEIIKNINTEKKKMAQPLVYNVAFMAATLNKLKDIINDKGPISYMEQGSQKMWIESPAQKSYNSMIKNFNTSMRQLFELLPKDAADIIVNAPDKPKPESEKDTLEKYQEKYNK